MISKTEQSKWRIQDPVGKLPSNDRRQREGKLDHIEGKNTAAMFTVAGAAGGGGGGGQNTGRGFVALADWKDRKGSDNKPREAMKAH